MSDHAETIRELAARAIDLRPEGWERAQAVKALAARCDALERERNETRNRLLYTQQDAVAAEARCDALEKALREIASLPDQSESWSPDDFSVRIARAALAAVQEQP